MKIRVSKLLLRSFTTCISHQTKSCTSTSHATTRSFLQERKLDKLKLLGSLPYVNKDSEGAYM